jgi:hypothetical protein
MSESLNWDLIQTALLTLQLKTCLRRRRRRVAGRGRAAPACAPRAARVGDTRPAAAMLAARVVTSPRGASRRASCALRSGGAVARRAAPRTPLPSPLLPGAGRRCVALP